jgi:hypothetical protein
MVVDRLDGEDVGALADRLGRLPVDLALRIAAQTCEGLVVAHAAGIIHRDIKPSNLFLTAPTATGRIVKILDFGIARVAAEPASGELTKTGMILGSPLYMAPEQLRGVRELDHRADVWSLGVVLYRLLCGVVPHAITTLADALIKVCIEPAPPLRERAPWVPEEVAALVHRALEIDVDRRTPSAQAFAGELAAVLGEDTTITDEMMVAYRPSGRQQPRAATPLADTLAPVVAPPEPVRRRPAKPKPRPRRTRGTFLWLLGVAAAFGAGTLLYRSTSETSEAEAESEPSPAPGPQPTPPPKPPPRPPVPPPQPVNEAPVPPLSLSPVFRDDPVDSPQVIWWEQHKNGCTPEGYRAVVASAPKVHGRRFAVACAAIAGDDDGARKLLSSRGPRDAEVVGAYAHELLARNNQDPVGMALGEVALVGQPDNFLWLYNVGIAEYQANKMAEAREHLSRYLDGAKWDDQFKDRVREIVAAMAAPKDCSVKLRDGRGRAVVTPGC